MVAPPSDFSIGQPHENSAKIIACRRIQISGQLAFLPKINFSRIWLFLTIVSNRNLIYQKYMKLFIYKCRSRRGVFALPRHRADHSLVNNGTKPGRVRSDTTLGLVVQPLLTSPARSLGVGCLCPSPQEQQEIFKQPSGPAELVTSHRLMDATARTYILFLSATIVGLVFSLQGTNIKIK